MHLRRCVLGPLAALLSGIDRSGQDGRIVSAYRSYAYQRRIFARFVERETEAGLSPEAARLAANRYSALPGHSEHQLGTTVDISIAGLDYRLDESLAETRLGSALLERAHIYGFVFSYPAGKEALTGYVYEPWHLRWIGIEHAEALFRAGYLDPNRSLTVADYLRDLPEK
jgi:D-alanyl-D-alanine carboxypeptidase